MLVISRRSVCQLATAHVLPKRLGAVLLAAVRSDVNSLIKLSNLRQLLSRSLHVRRIEIRNAGWTRELEADADSFFGNRHVLGTVINGLRIVNTISGTANLVSELHLTADDISYRLAIMSMARRIASRLGGRQTGPDRDCPLFVEKAEPLVLPSLRPVPRRFLIPQSIGVTHDHWSCYRTLHGNFRHIVWSFLTFACFYNRPLLSGSLCRDSSAQRFRLSRCAAQTNK